MMLKINIDGYDVRIQENINIPVKYKNPMFNEEGTHSLSFNLINNGIIRKLTNHLQIPSSVKLETSFDVKIYYGEDLFLYGDGILQKANKKNIQLYLLADKGSFNNNIKNKKLQDINFDDDINMGSDYDDVLSYLKATTTEVYPDKNIVAFPVKNTKFGENSRKTGYGLKEIQNKWYIDSGNVGRFGPGDMIVTPFIYLNYILEKLGKTYNYFVSENYFKSSEELNSLVIFNTYDVYYNWTAWTTDFYFNYAQNLPQIDISQFIKNIEKLFNVQFFPLRSKNEMKILNKSDIIKSADYIDITNLSEPNNDIDLTNITGVVLEIEPDDKDEFWEEKIDDIYGDEYSIKDSVSTYANLPSQPEINDLRYVEDEDNWYVYNLADGAASEDWNFFSRNRQKKKVGDDDDTEDISTDISTLLLDYIDMTNEEIASPYQDGILIPRTEQQGNSVHHKSRLEPALRLLFYRGLQKSENNYDYPFGSSDVYKYSGIKISDANMALKWEGDYGLYEKCYKEYIDWFLEKKTVKKTIHWRITDLLNLDFSKKYRINGDDYLIKEIPVNLKKNRISVGQTILVKI